MKKVISILIAMLLLSPSVNATVAQSQIPDVLTEETVLTIKSKTMNSKSNPLKVSVVTVDGSVITLTPVVAKTGASAQILLPSIPDSVASLVQVTIKISGGDVSASAPQQFARILAKKPAGFTGETIPGNVAGTATSLPANTGSGIASEGPQGPKGENGAVGAIGPRGADGSVGAQGPIPTSYPGGNIAGPVASALVFTGSLAGDVTGPMSATAIANATITNKELNGGYVAAAGVVANGNSLQTAIAKLDGNILANDGDITTINSTLGAPTSSNTASQIVKRDASGNFSAGTITASSFSGPLAGNVTGNLTGDVTGNTAGVHTGNVTGNLTGSVLTASQANITTLAGLTAAGTTGVTTTFSGPVTAPEGVTANLTGNVTGNLTGNVTGNTSGSAASFTGSLSGDVGGTQSATTIANSVVTGKVLNGTYTPAVGTVVLGDTIQGAIAKLDANEQADALILANATDTNTAGRLVKRDASGNFAANTISATTFSGNLSGLINSGSSSQPNIQSLSGVQNLGTGGVPLTIYGPVSANSLITGTITHANNADTASTSGLASFATNSENATTANTADLAIFATNTQNATTANVADLATFATNTDNATTANIADLATLAIFATNTDNATTANVADLATLATNTDNATTANIADLATFATNTDNATTANAAGSLDAGGGNTITLTGGFAVTLAGTGTATLTLPSTSSTLATTTGLTPVATGAIDPNPAVDGTDLTGGEVSINVSGSNFILIDDTTAGGSDVVEITGGIDGQQITLLVSGTGFDILDTSTAVAGTKNIHLTAGSHSQGLGDTIVLVKSAGQWYEISRSNNT